MQTWLGGDLEAKRVHREDELRYYQAFDSRGGSRFLPTTSYTYRQPITTVAVDGSGQYIVLASYVPTHSEPSRTAFRCPQIHRNLRRRLYADGVVLMSSRPTSQRSPSRSCKTTSGSLLCCCARVGVRVKCSCRSAGRDRSQCGRMLACSAVAPRCAPSRRGVQPARPPMGHADQQREARLKP